MENRSPERPASSATDMAISPAPTNEEVAAILAATEALWPKPTVVASTWSTRNTAWRFSNRWWSKPVPARRDRPWL